MNTEKVVATAEIRYRENGQRVVVNPGTVVDLPADEVKRLRKHRAVRTPTEQELAMAELAGLKAAKSAAPAKAAETDEPKGTAKDDGKAAAKGKGGKPKASDLV